MSPCLASPDHLETLAVQCISPSTAELYLDDARFKGYLRLWPSLKDMSPVLSGEGKIKLKLEDLYIIVSNENKLSITRPWTCSGRANYNGGILSGRLCYAVHRAGS